MTEPPDAPPPSSPRRTVGIKLGSLTLTGPAAAAVGLLVLALIIALIVRSRPSLGMLLAGAIWLGFVVFWNLTAGRKGPGRSEESAGSRAVRQNLLTLSLLLLFVSIPGLGWRLIPPTQWHVPAGLAIMAAATLLHVWARVHLGRNWSSEVMIKTDHQLVRTGPYRFVRHPIYTAILGLAFGTAIVSGRLISMLGAAVFTYAYIRKLRIEERALGATFGSAWEDYRRRSWALVPWLY
jgi:protein-S-isoprenylcysteine O-methyltransferase Ste14